MTASKLCDCLSYAVERCHHGLIGLLSELDVNAVSSLKVPMVSSHPDVRELQMRMLDQMT